MYVVQVDPRFLQAYEKYLTFLLGTLHGIDRGPRVLRNKFYAKGQVDSLSPTLGT